MLLLGLTRESLTGKGKLEKSEGQDGKKGGAGPRLL